MQMSLCVCFAIGLQQLMSSVREDVVVHHLRPSKLVERCLAGTVARNVRVTADDEHSLIHLSGPRAEVAQFLAIEQLFDVEPKTLKVSLSLSSFADKTGYDAVLTLHNG